jgi:hypothetical protein
MKNEAFGIRQSRTTTSRAFPGTSPDTTRSSYVREIVARTRISEKASPSSISQNKKRWATPTSSIKLQSFPENDIPEIHDRHVIDEYQTTHDTHHAVKIVLLKKGRKEFSELVERVTPPLARVGYLNILAFVSVDFSNPRQGASTMFTLEAPTRYRCQFCESVSQPAPEYKCSEWFLRCVSCGAKNLFVLTLSFMDGG